MNISKALFFGGGNTSFSKCVRVKIALQHKRLHVNPFAG